MAIKFKCSNCQAALSVKDDSSAGRKIGCPKCKTLVVIPKPAAASPTPDEDVEALAAAALSEPKPDPVAVQASDTIDFECPQCGEPVKMAREFAGKNAPCPECRRIVRVPMPKAKDPADWRNKGDTLPTGARRDTEPVPEGAWESSRAKGVSAAALSEAGLIPKKKKPGLTRRQKITRGVGIGAAVLVVAVGGLFAWSAWAHNKQDTQVLAAAEAAEKGKSKEAAAEAHRAAGEYFLRTGTRDAGDKAQQRFAKARDLLEKSQPGPGRDVLLADLLVSQVDLGGTKEEGDRGVRLKPGPALEELKKTLSHVSSPAGRLHALRLVSRKLIAHDRAEDAAKLAGQSGGNKGADGNDPEVAFEGPEALAVVGIELFRAGNKELAGKLSDRSVQIYAQLAGEEQERPPLAPSVVALCLALGKPEPKPGKDDKEQYLIGQAVGLALKGDADGARKITPDKPELLRLQVLTAVADATGDMADVDAAEGLLDADPKAKPPSPWLVYRLVLVATAKPGQVDHALRLADRINDPGLKAMAQLQVVRARLEGNKDKAGDNVLEGIDSAPLQQALGREWLARHNAHHDSGTIKAIEGWDESVRPFGLLGAILGAQDGKGK
jgi:DNA-directed RNA polymerase subunit M/transcription elongation factor TFIIS